MVYGTMCCFCTATYITSHMEEQNFETTYDFDYQVESAQSILF